MKALNRQIDFQCIRKRESSDIRQIAERNRQITQSHWSQLRVVWCAQEHK